MPRVSIKCPVCDTTGKEPGEVFLDATGRPLTVLMFECERCLGTGVDPMPFYGGRDGAFKEVYPEKVTSEELRSQVRQWQSLGFTEFHFVIHTGDWINMAVRLGYETLDSPHETLPEIKLKTISTMKQGKALLLAVMPKGETPLAS